MDDILRDLVRRYGQDWRKISEEMGLSAKRIREHWKMFSDISRLPFSNEEDQRILDLGPIFAGCWSLMATNLGTNRSALQVRNRYASLVGGMPRTLFSFKQFD
jgi:hypothetical protein